MSIEMSDRSGEPPSVQDIDEAIKAVTKAMVSMDFMMKNPEIGVQLGNIRRCLLMLKQLHPRAFGS